MTDNLYDEAVRLTIEAGKGSTSVLQRSLGIGYARAVLLLDAMEWEGVVSPANGLWPRKLLPRERSKEQLTLF